MTDQSSGAGTALARIKPVKKRVFVTQNPAEGNPVVMPAVAERESPLARQLVHLCIYLAQALQLQVMPEEIFRLKKELENRTVSEKLILEAMQQHLGLELEITDRPLKKLKSTGHHLIFFTTDGSGLILLKPFREKEFRIYDPGVQKSFELSENEFRARISGRAIRVQGPKKPSAGRNLVPGGEFNALWLIKCILNFRGGFLQVLVAAVLIQVFALVTPLFTMVIIDKVFSASGFGTLHTLIIGLFAISVFDYLISTSRQLLLNNVTHKVDFILATAFFRKLTALPLSFFSTKQIGDSVSRVKELEVLRSFFTGSAFMLLIDFPFLLVFIGVMLLFSVTLTLTASTFILAVLLLYGVFGPFIREKLKNRNQLQSDNNSFLIETIGGIEAIKAMSLENTIQQRWNHMLVQSAKNSVHTERLTGHISQLAGFLTKSTTAVCLWLGAMLVLEGKLTPGQLIAFNMMVGRVIAPTQRISQLLQQLNQIRISLQRVGEIMNAAPELHVAEPSQLPSLKGAIRLEEVGFRYARDGKEVLKNISLEIKAGETVALIGATGSGKTTLLRLLQRLHLPTQGSIFIDGINIMGINPGWFREKIGVVSQETVLFNLSIMQNIRMAGPGNRRIHVEEVVEVCRLVGADEWIRRLPNAYDTVVGERGCFLSGGQRQQISIARALLRDPKILLMDEATSALDNESEKAVERNMERLFAGRTVIIVAHRLPSVHVVDRIFTLKDGELVGVDTPNPDRKKSHDV